MNQKSSRPIRSSFSPLLSIIFMSLIHHGVTGQEKSLDEIEILRRVPAHTVKSDVTEMGLAQIEWQLKRFSLQYQTLKADLSQQQAKVKTIDEQLEKMAGELPIEARFVDGPSRSRVVGKALEELLSAKLDLAVGAARIELVEKKSKKVELTKKQLAQITASEIDVKLAAQSYSSAESSFEHAKRLAESAFVSEKELLAERNKMTIAKLKLEKAEINLDIVKSSHTNAKSGELATLRLQMVPVESRVKAAESFLQKFVIANGTHTKMETLHRKREQIFQHMNRIEGRLFELDLEMMELKTLKEMVTDSNK